MVTATYGTATFRGIKSNRTYAVDLYIADVIGTAVKFDSGSGAGTGSLPYWKASEACILVDLSIATGPTIMTSLVLTSDGAQIPAARFRIANYLNTLNNRPAISIGIAQGSNFGATEA